MRELLGREPVWRCPYGAPGDRLWVRETWCPRANGMLLIEQLQRPFFAATDGDGDMAKPPAWPWRPSIRMPRWASRILLEVTEVRVERLQAITEEDARAEGVERIGNVGCPCEGDSPNPGPHLPACPWSHGDVDPDFNPHRAAFAVMWDAINGARAPWDSDPWVWAVSFRRITP